MFALLGCPSPEGVCNGGEACPEGSYCVRSQNVGVCTWGKPSPDNPNLAIPDIRFHLTEGTLRADRRMNGPITIHADVYGAPLGTESQIQTPHELLFSACAELSTEADGEHRRLECSSRMEESPEGDYFLKVTAHGVNGTTEEIFAWGFDATPPEARMRLAREAWKRDDALYVQLEGSEDMDWEKSELLFGDAQHSAIRSVCAEGLVAKPNAECFSVPLSLLPNLPHGGYALKLKALLVDKIGNAKIQEEVFSLKISRVLWVSQQSDAYQPVAAQENLAIFARDTSELVAFDVEGKQRWRLSADELGIQWDNRMDFLLGTHRNLQVLVKTCTTTEGNGLSAFNARTGASLLRPHCLAPKEGVFSVALLQGSPSQDLVLARNGDFPLESCQLIGNLAQGQGEFHCESASVGSTGTGSTMVVQPREGKNLVYFPGARRSWVSFEWHNHVWDAGNLMSDTAGESGDRKPIFGMGTWHLWGENWESSLQTPSGLGVLSPVTMFPDSMTGTTPWAVDVEDALLVSRNDGSFLHYKPNHPPLYLGQEKRFPSELFLMEEGDILLVENQSSVALFNAQLELRWQEDFADFFGDAPQIEQAFLMPSSPSATRSLLVVEVIRGDGSVVYGGILIDSPGLKQHAPWPMRGHDPCRTFHSGVPANNCWSGPKI